MEDTHLGAGTSTLEATLRYKILALCFLFSLTGFSLAQEVSVRLGCELKVPSGWLLDPSLAPGVLLWYEPVKGVPQDFLSISSYYGKKDAKFLQPFVEEFGESWNEQKDWSNYLSDKSSRPTSLWWRYEPLEGERIRVSIRVWTFHPKEATCVELERVVEDPGEAFALIESIAWYDR